VIAHLPADGRKALVHYIGLPKSFIAGAVYCGDTGECLEGARISLFKESGQKILSTVTDNYGDFEFENLGVDSEYSVKIEAEGYDGVAIEGIHTQRDVCVKDTYLQRRHGK
jgi:hypothetical protein